MSDVANQTVHSGHTIQIVYNGKPIGKIQGLDGERNFGTQGLYEIGSIMPKEHIPLRYEGTVNVERFFVKNADMKKAGMASLSKDVLSKGIIDIVVSDKYATAALSEIRTYHGCTIVSYRETFRVNAIAGENASFTYLYVTSADLTAAQARD